MAEEFSRRQVELILRRTAELERRGDETIDVVTPADLEKVAVELGLSQDALKQALAEARAGMLQVEEPKGLVDKMFGAKTLEIRRFVPGDVASVRGAVDRFLQEQGFELKRNRGDVTVWQAAQDIWTRVRVAMRRGSYRLPREIEIEVRVARVPGGPQPVLVRLLVDASRLRGNRVSGAAVGMGAGAIAIAVGSVLLPMPLEIAAWAAGGGAAALAALGGRASYRGARERLEIALERFLDFLEHEPAATISRPQPDIFSRLSDFLNGDWWR